jgi:arylsulfatase A-like enzyme
MDVRMTHAADRHTDSTPCWLEVAVASAFAAAWLELAFRHLPLLSGKLVFTGRHTLWITPLSNLLILVPAGAFTALVCRFVPPLQSLQARLFLQGLPAVFGVLWLLFPRIHPYAIVVLSLGMAVQLARLAAARPWLARRAVRSMIAAGAVVMAVSMASTLLEDAGRRRALSTASMLPAGAPNVLLVVLDTVRASSLSVYGYERPTTPELEAFAEHAVMFRTSFATTSWTLPSHASMFTGRYPYELSADWERPLDGAEPTLAEVLRDAGYRTGGFVGNIEYTSRETGLARGFQHFGDWPLSFGRVASESSLAFFLLDNPAVRRLMNAYEPFVQRPAEEVIGEFLAWKRSTAAGGQPYFAFLNLYDAHEPLIPPEPYLSRFGATSDRRRAMTFGRLNGGALRPGDPLTPAELDMEERAYDGAIAYLDAEIGRLLRVLSAEGELQSTVVIITSDHGEHFGEHGLRSHGTALYSPGLHVPLLIGLARPTPVAGPVDTPVSLRDLGATVLDLVGIREHPLPGTSLSWAWGSGGDAPEPSILLSELWPPRNVQPDVPVAKGYMRSLVQWPLQLIQRADGVVELLNLAGDRDGGAAGADRDHARTTLDNQVRAIPPTPFAGRSRVPAP